MHYQHGTGWFAAPNRVFGDSLLSALDKLVLLYLIRCAGPDGCAWPGHRKIAEDCGLCEKTVRNCLANLQELGRITAEKRFSESGSIRSNLYKVESGYDVPPSVRDTIPPVPRTDTPGKRYQTPPVRDTDRRKPIKKVTQRKDSPLVPQGERFVEFWEAYPRRKGSNPKQTALVAYERAVRGNGKYPPANPDDILKGVEAYKRSDPGERGAEFIAQAATWLNQRRWEDDYSVVDERAEMMARLRKEFGE